MSEEMNLPSSGPFEAAAYPSHVGTSPFVGSKLVRLEQFEPAVGLSGAAFEAYARRFTTLFVDESTKRRGGIGQVVLATNALGEQFALKMLIVPEKDEAILEDDYANYVAGLKAAFRQEFECHKSVSGLKGFPRLYGAGEVGGVPAIVMEWVRGETLAQAAPALAVDSAGRCSPLVAAQIGRDIFDLLSRLDCIEGGFAHRDISPNNVMLRTSRLSIAHQVEEGSFDVCLIDFGSSAPAQTGASSFTSAQAVTRKATADFAPPEMLTDDVAGLDELRKSPKIDVYAAASVTYWLACGRAPFDLSANVGAVASAYRAKTEGRPLPPAFAHAVAADISSVLLDEPEVAKTLRRVSAGFSASPDAEEVRDALAFVDDQLVDVLMACLACDQEERPSAAEAHGALSAFCGHYLENVERSLKGEPLVPCTFDGVAEGTLRELFGTRSTVRVAGCAASLVVGCAVVVSAGLNAAGLPASVDALGVSWAGELSPWAIMAALAVPTVVGMALRAGARSTLAGFARGSVGLLAAACVVAGAFALFVVSPPSALGSLLAALLAASAAGWCPMALDYALAIAAGPVRKRAREELPAGSQTAEKALAGAVDALPAALGDAGGASEHSETLGKDCNHGE